MTTTYDELTAEAAQDHLTRYVATLPRRLDWLRANAEVAGVVLDATPESLVPLWTWALRHEPDLDAPRDGADLPTWLQYDEGFCARWGPWLLALVDGLVAYLAEVFSARYPETTWVVGSAPAAVNSIDQNRPVLAVAGRKEVNLPHIVTVRVFKGIVSRQDGNPEALLRLYRIWEQGLS